MPALYQNVAGFIQVFGEDDCLAMAGVGGYNSSGGRSIDEPQIEADLKRASDTINGYCLARYPRLVTLDFNKIPDLLKGIASDLARYWLRDRAGDRAGVDEVVKHRYEEAMKMLRDLQKARIDLPLKDENGALISEDSQSINPVRHTMPSEDPLSVLGGY